MPDGLGRLVDRLHEREDVLAIGPQRDIFVYASEALQPLLEVQADLLAVRALPAIVAGQG